MYARHYATIVNLPPVVTPIFLVESSFSTEWGSIKLFPARMLNIAHIFNVNFYFRCENQAMLDKVIP